MSIRRGRSCPAAPAWDVQVLVVITIVGERFVATQACRWPSLPPIGTTVAFFADHSRGAVVEDVTCWPDGSAGVMLEDADEWELEALERLERHGWEIRSISSVEAGLHQLLDGT